MFNLNQEVEFQLDDTIRLLIRSLDTTIGTTYHIENKITALSDLLRRVREAQAQS